MNDKMSEEKQSIDESEPMVADTMEQFEYLEDELEVGSGVRLQSVAQADLVEPEDMQVTDLHQEPLQANVTEQEIQNKQEQENQGVQKQESPDEEKLEAEPDVAGLQSTQPLIENLDEETALRLLEAIIFASPEPQTIDALYDQMGAKTDVASLLQTLQSHYNGRGVMLVETGGGWCFRTALDLAEKMKITKKPRRKLPRAAAEVLAIIAYHQPLTRAEIESIRGVETSRGTLDLLLELGWIRPGKRKETPGRPLTWTTTAEFLAHFNLGSLNELPGLDELKAAGLLDTRPILSNLPPDKEGGDTLSADKRDEDDYGDWVSDPRIEDGADAA